LGKSQADCQISAGMAFSKEGVGEQAGMGLGSLALAVIRKWLARASIESLTADRLRMTLRGIGPKP